MDEALIKANLKRIFALEIVIAACGVAILILITTTAINTGFDEFYYIGSVVCTTFAIIVPIGIIVLSVIGNINMAKNPKLVYIFSIISLILSISQSGASITGAALIVNSIGTDLYWIDLSPTPEKYVFNLGLHIANAVIFIGVVVVLILVIVSCAKNIKESSEVAKQAMTRVVSSPSTPAAATSNGGKKFCSECGNPNDQDAKFCKKCGKPV